jgi:hypothetical protein
MRRHRPLRVGVGDRHILDGTMIWTLPDGQIYVTTGSALLFPTLCAPTGALPTPDPARADRCGDKTATMSLRTRTRAQNRAHRIAAERRQIHDARTATAQAPSGRPTPRRRGTTTVLIRAER